MKSDFKKKLYDESYSHEWNMTKTDKIRIEKAMEMVERGGKILDLGCFTGVIGKKISELGNDVYGIELSAPAMEKAGRRGIKVIRHDADHILPIKSGSFDGIFAGEIIEHLFDVDTFLSETNRVLKNNGYLVLTTPNLLSFWNRLRAVFGKSFIDFNRDKQHIRFFTKHSLQILLKKHGFSVEKIIDTPLVLPLLSRYGIMTKRGFMNSGEGIIVKARKIK